MKMLAVLPPGDEPCLPSGDDPCLPPGDDPPVTPRLGGTTRPPQTPRGVPDEERVGHPGVLLGSC